MRVLVTGAGGQIGRELTAHCRRLGDDVIAATRADLDVSDRDAVLAAIGAIRPDVVYNTAAWTAVDACEGDRDRAWRHNALAVRWCREACERTGSHLLQLSSYLVFDGRLGRPYHEWDPPSAATVFGASKAAGEREAGDGATIVRTSWVSGRHGNNMVKTVLRLAAEEGVLAFVDDQYGCPTFAADLVVMLRRLAVDRRAGIYHVTNAGAVSWYDFIRDIVIAAGYDPGIVSPIATADLAARPALRPPNGVLDNAALRLGGITPLRPYHAPLADLVARLV